MGPLASLWHDRIMSPHSDEYWARELAAAVLSVARRKPSHDDIGAVEWALDAVLCGHGSDGVRQLTISDDGAGQITILASNWWLPQRVRTVEAKFNLSASPPPETSDAPDQYTQVRDSIRLAACQPYVGAYFNFLLFDESRLAGWQSGAFWADQTPKDSLPGFREAITEANAATVDCDALKGGRPSADFMPPSAPTDRAAFAWPDPLRVELTWSPSTDEGSSVSYRVYRNGAQVATTSATAWTTTGVAAATTYTYTVRAIDSAGNLGGASPAATVTTPPADTTPPETTIGSGSAGTVASRSASFTFSASESGALYDCALDAAPFAPCSSPHTYSQVAAGAHSFLVRAKDAAGNADPTPAIRSWTVVSPSPVQRNEPARGVVRTGTARRDILRGTPGPDVLRGLGGADLLYGLGGNDVLIGGRGQDRLLAGRGSDVVHVRDGAHDTITCGAGRDLVYGDRGDHIARDCERIRQSGQRK
jgi:chitodextrinase